MITNSKLVFKVNEIKTKNQLLEIISEKLFEEGFSNSKKQVLDGLKAREKSSSTGLSDGIAIPHVCSPAITEAKVIVMRLKEKVNWKSLDGKPVDMIIAIAVPENGRNDHFEILTQISTNLADPKFIQEFKKGSNKSIVEILNNIKIKKIETKVIKNAKINIVGVTTCVTGVAHTFMAAQALEDEGKARGWNVKIERQGQMTKNILKDEDIKNADYVIIGQSKLIDGQERFNGKKVYIVEVAEPITKSKKIFDEIEEKAILQQGFGSSSTTSTGNSAPKQGIMSHMMAGISYMIPYIAMAGITLGLTTAFGFDFVTNDNGQLVFAPASDIAQAFKNLADAAFTLYIPILAMFIANSIAGRKAMAPAAILGLMLNTGIDPTLMTDSGNVQMQFAPFWNWSNMSFQFDSSPALGFLGAIASGYMVGFGIKWFTHHTDKVEIQVFQTVLPLLIIPLLFTIVPWLFMAFIGYLPLFYLASGLNSLVQLLINNNLFWIAGGIMGAMICFDLGGPVNKMAMTIGVLMMSEHPEVNGICAVAVSIPASVLFFSLITQKLSPLKMDEDDKTAAASASVMGFFGITEGSIPFAAKEPKKWMPSFIFAGIVGGILMSFTGITDNVAMWGGPIIYIAGGLGSTNNDSSAMSEWVLTLWYFVPLIVAGLVGAILANILEIVYGRLEKISEKESVLVVI